jgi:hypothetical protein
LKSALLLISSITLLNGCAGGRGNDSSWDPILHGTIDYPFADRANPLGENGPSEKFVIRSTVGNTEYTMEIPGAARDYDIEVPLADLSNLGSTGTSQRTVGGVGGARPNSKDISNPQLTDRELVSDMPKLPEPEDRGLVDGAFGVGQMEGPTQSPSYAMRIAKINELYLSKEYEFALIEINNMLTYYPGSAKLYKMKGTILLKLRNLELGEIAWTRAVELAPTDVALKNGLKSLRARIEFNKKITVGNSASAIQPAAVPTVAPRISNSTTTNQSNKATIPR